MLHFTEELSVPAVSSSVRANSRTIVSEFDHAVQPSCCIAAAESAMVTDHSSTNADTRVPRRDSSRFLSVVVRVTYIAVTATMDVVSTATELLAMKSHFRNLNTRRHLRFSTRSAGESLGESSVGNLMAVMYRTCPDRTEIFQTNRKSR